MLPQNRIFTNARKHKHMHRYYYCNAYDGWMQTEACVSVYHVHTYVWEGTWAIITFQLMMIRPWIKQIDPGNF